MRNLHYLIRDGVCTTVLWAIHDHPNDRVVRVIERNVEKHWLWNQIGLPVRQRIKVER